MFQRSSGSLIPPRRKADSPIDSIQSKFLEQFQSYRKPREKPSGAKARQFIAEYRRHKGVKFHDIAYKAFRDILYTWVMFLQPSIVHRRGSSVAAWDRFLR